MSSPHPPLTPWPLPQLLRRIAGEWERRREIFSLPERRFFRRPEGIDLSCSIGGGRAATPVGPAAGPHTQLAQNLVLSWLAGARTFELKTVQILDELEIPRPCIDMENVGYNVEWSQELRLEQSRREYAKTALLLALLRRWEPLRQSLAGGDDSFLDAVLEMSVGYDLAGLQTPRMHAFLSGMRDAGDLLESMRRDLPAPFAGLADAPVDPCLVRMTNLSTFHGCPPGEIEDIVRHLMTAHELDVTVKLNPTLLGPGTVAEILHERLGHREVELVPEAFAADLKFERALEMIDRLDAFARERGRRFGIKLTNTLVVRNGRGILPEERMYLSGAPLHVLAVTLLDRLHAALPGRLAVGEGGGRIPVAFSAGVDKGNLAGLAALGLEPVTICSDLLRPGGYGRMSAALKQLVRTMQEEGAADLSGLRARANQSARAAGHADAVAATAARLAGPEGAAPYSRAVTDRALRRVDSDLQTFDCVACNNCVTVCPNDAFLALPTPEGAGLQARTQFVVLAEWCNDCGNCTTFCPERGAPQRIKPRLRTAASEAPDPAGEYRLATGPDGGWLVQAPDAHHEQEAKLLTRLVGGEGAAGLPWREAD